MNEPDPDEELMKNGSEQTIECGECDGTGIVTMPTCCGNTVNGECRGDCVIPVQEQCFNCEGQGTYQEWVQNPPA